MNSRDQQLWLTFDSARCSLAARGQPIAAAMPSQQKSIKQHVTEYWKAAFAVRIVLWFDVGTRMRTLNLISKNLPVTTGNVYF
jgi:hypothetical protein